MTYAILFLHAHFGKGDIVTIGLKNGVVAKAAVAGAFRGG
jgi:hypothetical protein